MTKQNQKNIEIRNSKALNLFYAGLGLLTILIINLKFLSELYSNSNLLYLDLIVSALIGLPCIIFLVKSTDKKPIFTIDLIKIVDHKTGKIYELKDFRYFKYEEIGARYVTIKHLHFFDINKTPKFKIHTTNTDFDFSRTKTLLETKLTELK